jgi:hypothetical protein
VLNSVFFVSDFYYGDWSKDYGRIIEGGAESHDKVLISELRKHFNVDTKRCIEISIDDIINNRNKVWFFTNFGNLKREHIDLIIKYDINYFIYEHDHKYLMSRNPTMYKDWIAPIDHTQNLSFFKNAEMVYVNSTLSKNLMLKNLRISNDDVSIYNVRGNFFSDETFKVVSNLLGSKVERNNKAFIIKSNESAKSCIPAVQFCERSFIEYDLVDKCTHNEILNYMRSYSILVYFTSCVDTFCRLIAEANMLNCRMITNPKQMGIYSDRDVVELKGCDMVNYLQSCRDVTILDMINNINDVVESDK